MDFWTVYNFGVPTLLAIVAYAAYHLHERDIDRKIRRRRAETHRPGE